MSLLGPAHCVDAKLQHGARCVAGHDRGTRWFRVQLKPDCVPIANTNLGHQGFRTFLPMEEETRQRNGKLVTTSQRFCSVYLFAAFDKVRASDSNLVRYEGEGGMSGA
jgi:hypothetical protein